MSASFLDVVTKNDGIVNLPRDHYVRARAELQRLRDRVAELEAQPVTLTPRPCATGRQCYVKGWDAAIKAAAAQANRHVKNNGSEYDDSDGAFLCAADIESSIRALNTPDACADCNPLDPRDAESSNRDTLDGIWIHALRMNLVLNYNNSGDVCEVLIGGDDMVGIQEAAERIKTALARAPKPMGVAEAVKTTWADAATDW